MTDFVVLTCPSCGGKLHIRSHIDLFACGYCSTELKVNRGGGIVSLDPVIEGIDRVRVGVDKTASELAITRLKSDMHSLETGIKKIADWFREVCPDNEILKRSLNIDVFVKAVEDDLSNRKKALNKKSSRFWLFTDRKSLEIKRRDMDTLENALGKLKSLVSDLRGKRSELKRHEQIVSQ